MEFIQLLGLKAKEDRSWMMAKFFDRESLEMVIFIMNLTLYFMNQQKSFFTL